MVIDDTEITKRFHAAMNRNLQSQFGNIQQVPSYQIPIVSGVVFPPPLQQKQFEFVTEDYTAMGNKVLQNIEAHDTKRIGELATSIHEKLNVLKATATLTNSQWQQFAELTSSINELLGDQYDAGSTDAD